MHARVFAEFDSICRERRAGGDVLEVGAVPAADTLLCLPALRDVRSRTGVNMDGPHAWGDLTIQRANANDLSGFADASFDTVLCNAMLEHDPRFWKSIAEIRRVARAGALIVIGVPGYTTLAGERRVSRVARLGRRLGLSGAWLDAADASTLTLRVHNFPGDYYRFSPQAVREIFLEGLVDTEVRTVLSPPRLIAIGVKGTRGV